MIIVKLQGGLGNQMFQYALGRALSLRLSTDVVFDKTWYSNILASESVRSYELDIFSLSIRFAKVQEIPLEQRSTRSRYIYYRNNILQRIPVWRPICGLPSWVILSDYSLQACEKVFELRASQNVFLNGYWQSEEYFKDAKELVRKDFFFRESPDQQNQAILGKMSAEFNKGIEPVSVHVRRGDYSSNPQINAVHGVLPLEYYQSAMAVIEKEYPRVFYYVFSDDLAWCRKNLRFKTGASFVDVNSGRQGWMDMRLMSSCRHHIIANSSFSWWGAWINSNENKIVIAPQEWFADQKNTTIEVVPPGWIKV